MKNKEIEELLNILCYEISCQAHYQKSNHLEICKNCICKCRQYELLEKILSYIEQLEKKAELGDHYKHLYSEVKKQKDELEKENRQLKEKLNCKEYFSSTMPEGTEFVILTKNNYDRQQKDLVLENIQLKKQKDDVVGLIKARIKENEGHINARMEIYHYKNILRMLGEIDE